MIPQERLNTPGYRLSDITLGEIENIYGTGGMYRVFQKNFCFIINRNQNLIAIIIFVRYSENQPTNCAPAQRGFPVADI